MASVTVRNLPDEVHRALRLRAAQHGVSTEAEIRTILAATVAPLRQTKLGSLLAEIGQDVGGVDLNITRDKTVTAPISFE